MDEFNKCAAVLERVKGVPGLMSSADCASLIVEAAQAPRGPRIEIGCLLGLSTCCISCASHPDDVTISIDPFDTVGLGLAGRTAVYLAGGPKALEEPSFYSNWRKYVEEVTRPRSVLGVVGCAEYRVDEVVELLAGKQAGFLFIDGNHNYDVMMKQLEHYLRLLQPEATIVFHDNGPQWPGVARAVKESAARRWIRIVSNKYLAVAKKGTVTP